MMDLGGCEVACTPPRGTSITLVSSSSHIPTPVANMKMPTTTLQDTATELTNGGFLSLTPTSASPQMGQSRFHGGLTTPSPDSAIHSVASGCHSPSQSPIQSRQLSGLSSPFSIRGTPSSLSRNNSDASQHGRSASPVGLLAPGSPMTFGGSGSSSQNNYMPPANASSPQNSPISNRHVIQGRQITLPSSPLPPSTIANNSSTKPITMYQGIVLSRHHSEDTNECSNISNEGPVTEVSSMTAPPGISRQQLINR